jgi:ribonuclease BN (tRNA processing enzyme)
MAGRELLAGLVEATDTDAVLALTAKDRQPPLSDELRALGCAVFIVHANREAKRPGKRVRARRRTTQWDTYLGDADERQIDRGKVRFIGTPPPDAERGAWIGRQIALIHQNQTQCMGEVVHLEAGLLTVRLPVDSNVTDIVLVRDATRGLDGMIETAEKFVSERLEYFPPPDVMPSVEENGGPRVTGRVGHVDVSLLNGVFGDPQLHLRLRHQGRSLLFDLGNGGRLPARLAHQITDVFISHAHMDHISGFQWLLRSRLGDLPLCRVYGPPGLARHIEGFIQCFLWDRIEDRGPVFQVAELHGDGLRRYRLQAGKPGLTLLDEQRVIDDVLHEEPGFRVRGVMLDHHTPVMAFAFEPDRELNIRKDRLTARDLEPGPWLGELKQQLLADKLKAMVTLPDGTTSSVKELADELVLIKPGKRLVYATDLADTEDNRQRLMQFAQGAHTFFCEAPFIEADHEQATRTGHLTARACGEIAAAAGVARLVPFHFSRRYAHQPEQLYDEIAAACSCLVAPKRFSIFESPAPLSGDEAVYLDNGVARCSESTLKQKEGTG